MLLTALRAAIAMATSAASPAACAPLPGAESFLTSLRAQIVWVGEVHGTSDQPGLFGDLVCAAAELGKPVLVVLERDKAAEPAWGAFLRSDGGPAAQADFLKTGEWTTAARDDGRSSRAMLALAQTLRRDFQGHRILGVKLMLRDLPPDISRDDYEAAMASEVEDAASQHPEALVFAYSGNIHAKKGSTTIGDETYAFAARHLASTKVASIVILSNPGTVWNCQADGCGPHPYSAKPHPRELSTTEAPWGYDGIAYTGLSTTASPPAAASASQAATNPGTARAAALPGKTRVSSAAVSTPK